MKKKIMTMLAVAVIAGVVAAAASALEPPQELVGTTWDVFSDGGRIYFTENDVLFVGNAR